MGTCKTAPSWYWRTKSFRLLMPPNADTDARCHRNPNDEYGPHHLRANPPSAIHGGRVVTSPLREASAQVLQYLDACCSLFPDFMNGWSWPIADALCWRTKFLRSECRRRTDS